MTPIDYASIAASATAASQKWTEPHLASLTVRLYMAGLIYEALQAACKVPGLVYEELPLCDGFSLRIGERCIRYEWSRGMARITRTKRRGHLFPDSFEEAALVTPDLSGGGVAAQAEMAEAVRQIVAGW